MSIVYPTPRDYTDFRSLVLGWFHWFTFIVVVVLLDIEHHRFIQGIIADIVNTVQVIKQKNLKEVILTHRINNLGLGIFTPNINKYPILLEQIEHLGDPYSLLYPILNTYRKIFRHLFSAFKPDEIPIKLEI